ncbi:MAG: hypothetical protein WDN45_01160 [Caulobacteraceae bacterium]
MVGEVLIADNGSTDGSQLIAEEHGARVVAIPRAWLWRGPHRRHPRRPRPLRDHGRRRRQLRLREPRPDDRQPASRGRPGDGQPLQGRHHEGRHALPAQVPGAIRCCRSWAGCCSASRWATSTAACAASRGSPC